MSNKQRLVRVYFREYFVETIFFDEVICKIDKVLSVLKVLSVSSHFYLLSRDFPPPELDRHAETFGILRYKPEISLLTAQQAFGVVDIGNIAQISSFVNLKQPR